MHSTLFPAGLEGRKEIKEKQSEGGGAYID
jgi:hypothetical protein